jgi:ABC-2 type transport system ATP-binding protein
VDGGPATLSAAATALAGAHVDVDDLALRRPTLDEVFLALTGHAAVDAEDAALGRDAGNPELSRHDASTIPGRAL